MVVCSSCFDLERVTQWVQSLQGFIERYGCPFLYAECRTYYGRVLFENGDWGAAETLLVEAISMSQGVFEAPHAFASGTLAELRLAQGQGRGRGQGAARRRGARPRPPRRSPRCAFSRASHRRPRLRCAAGWPRPARTGSMSSR